MTERTTPTAGGLLEDLAEVLDVPESRYEAATRSYDSLGRWLNRPSSILSGVHATIYAQGSFRLGTTIRPISDREEYDLDVVCEVATLKDGMTQAQLKALIGREVREYAAAHGMENPSESRRCWTLQYADGAQFHMDVLPALPDGLLQKMLLEARGEGNRWVQNSVAITDTEHPHFQLLGGEWPASNPKGYSEWFWSRMRVVFDERRKGMAIVEKRASVEEVPEFRVKTPLQSVVQILKRHRDLCFADRPEVRPISIVVTTLSAHAYNQQRNISDALAAILESMDRYVVDRGGTLWVANPTDPRENFADKWVQFPERRDAFYEWLESARTDFREAARIENLSELVELLAPRLGRNVVERAAERRSRQVLKEKAPTRPSAPHASLHRVLAAPHRQKPRWHVDLRESVEITRAWVTYNGRQRPFQNDGFPLPKHGSLQFEARTSARPPFQAFWQVVNTGVEAAQRGQARGGFDAGDANGQRIVRSESTLYRGTHSIECFIVKDNVCVAQSGPFIVNVA